MSDRKQRDERLREIAPYVWSMYQHVFEARSKLENKLNYFLAINTVILLCAFQILQSRLAELPPLYIVPLFALLLPVLLLLANFFTPPLRVPWVEKEILTKCLDSGEFYPLWIASAFACAYGSDAYQKRIMVLLRTCLSLIAFGLGWLTIMFVLNLCGSSLSQYEKVFLLLMVAGGIGAVIRLLMKNRVANFGQSREQEVYGFLKQWLEGEDRQTQQGQ